MIGAANIFVACRKLDDNFLKIPHPKNKANVNYQKCSVCQFAFAGGNSAKKAHVAGIDINGTLSMGNRLVY